MRFLVDAQLPPGLTRFFTSQKHEAWHVRDIGLRSADDAAVWDRAVSLGAVIVTKDEDFVFLRTSRLEGPPVVWVRVGNVGNQTLLSLFERLFPEIMESLQKGEKLVEVS